MEDKELIWICPKTSAKIVSMVIFCITTIMSLVGISIFVVASLTTNISAAANATINAGWLSGSIYAILIMPFIYTLLAYIFVFMVAKLFNFIASKYGGIKFKAA